MSDKERIVARIPAPLKRRVREAADGEGQSLTEFLKASLHQRLAWLGGTEQLGVEGHIRVVRQDDQP